MESKKPHCFIRKRSKSLKNAIVLCMVVFGISSCEDIFETDLSDKKVVLIAPGDNVETTKSTQTFYWEELKGALNYNLMVVTPSFDRIEQVIADTNVTTHRFLLNLNPGKYQWRVIGKNGSSRTDSFTIWRLQVDSTTDLTNQQVELSGPASGLALNSNNITFQWKKSYNAKEYNLQIGSPDLNGTKFLDTTVSVTSVPVKTNLADGNYTWGVKAINNSSSTSFSTRTFMIDKTVPNKPVLLEPSDKKVVTEKKVKLLWSRDLNDGGSRLMDSVFISLDSAALAKFAINNINKYKVDTIGFMSPLTVDTVYFWRIRTFDAAGNRSDASDIRKFKIKTSS